MKTYKLLMAAALIMLAACNSNPPENENQGENNHEQSAPKEGRFNGTVVVVGGNVDMTVTPPVVGDFSKDEVYVTLEKQEDGTYNILLEEVNFSNMMTNSINMAIPQVSLNDGVISSAADEEFVNPLLITAVGTAPDSNYEISKLTGKVNYTSDGGYKDITLSMTVTMVRNERRTAYPTSYEGKFEEVTE